MIKKIRITGFRSLHDVTVDLDPVTVLVGRSGSGKSAFVQAIRFLRNYLLNPKVASQIDGGWNNLLSAIPEANSLSYDILFCTSENDANYRYYVSFGSFNRRDQPDPLIHEEVLFYDDNLIFHRKMESNGQWKWLKPPDVIDIPDIGWYTALNKLPSMEKVVYAATALTSGIGYYSFPTGIWGPVTYSVPELIGNMNRLLSGMTDDGSNYLDVMRSINHDLQKPHIRKSISASLKLVNPSVSSVELDSISSAKRAIVGHIAGNKILQLDLSQESDGFRRFYAHLLALYQVPPKLLNIFEEPENAIYPGALSLLADEFKAAPASRRGQVILTTHSPGLLDHFSVDSLRVVEMRDGKTLIGPVSKEQADGVRENLLTTGELLTVDPARIDESVLKPEAAEA